MLAFETIDEHYIFNSDNLDADISTSRPISRFAVDI